MQKIKLVDGFKVRNTIDIDFGVIGNHKVYSYIPKGQIWFDKAFRQEEKFYVELFLKRLKLINKYGYEKAKAMLRPKLKKVDRRELILKEIKKGRTYSVFLVDGAVVRRSLDPSFSFGGHWLVYKYVPVGEIWLDASTDKRELKYVLLHEVCELQLMKKGKNYNNAHDYACAVEKEARRNDGVAYYIKD